jgi:integrase
LHVKKLKHGGVSRTFCTRLPNPQRSKRGLGAYPVVGLAEARDLAIDAHRAFAAGKPTGARAERRQRLAEAKRSLTLGKAIDGAPAPPYENAKSDAIRERALHIHFKPLHARDVASITAADIAGVLRTLKPQTAIKAHAAVRAVFDYAAAVLEPRGVTLINPADPRRLRSLGWSPLRESTPHPAVDWRVMPSVVAELMHLDDVAAKCVLFIVATGARAGAARLAKWVDINLEASAWTPPLADLKDGRHHKRAFIAPLNEVALSVLERMRGSPHYVFANSRGGPLGENALINLTRRLRRRHPDWVDPHTNEPFTIHGFRSALRTWAEETRRADSVLAELCLGHKVHGDVAGRYIRTGLVSERRVLLEAWSRHLCGDTSNVVTLPSRLIVTAR